MKQHGVCELVAVDCAVYIHCRSLNSEAYTHPIIYRQLDHLLNGSLLFLQFLVVLNSHRQGDFADWRHCNPAGSDVRLWQGTSGCNCAG